MNTERVSKVKDKAVKSICISLAFIILSFVISGCSAALIRVGDLIFEPQYNENTACLSSTGKDGTIDEYSNKVQLHICYGTDYSDELILCNSTEPNGDDEFFYDEYTILTGDFSKHCWKDNKLFIIMEEIYYEFDINSYEPPAIDDAGNINYVLKEYTKEEFVNAYPDSESVFGWKWYGC